MKRIQHFAMLVVTIATLYGCGAPEPVPSEAVKFCLDTGGIPNYRSNPVIVEFVCMKPKPPKMKKSKK